MADRTWQELREDLKKIPDSDYRLSSEPSEKPSGLILGGEKLINEFFHLAAAKFGNLKKQPFVVVNQDINLFLVKDRLANTHNAVASAAFPITEQKFSGVGFIDIKMGDREKPQIGKSLITFIKKAGMEQENRTSFIIEETPAKNGEPFFALYKFVDDPTIIRTNKANLVQFGNSKFGWRKPKPESYGISFPGEEPLALSKGGLEIMTTIDIYTFFLNLNRNVKHLSEMGVLFK